MGYSGILLGNGRYFFIFGAVALSSFNLAAQAQVALTAPRPSPSPTPMSVAVQTERIIVTGSKIPAAEEVGPNPVLTINRDYIEHSGERTTAQLLRNLPIANANGVPTSNNANGFAAGASSISLRGFDPSATLVLIDGRRVAPYPVGAGGTQSFIDLNSIPAEAIESIEILKDGASTTYGADAVAGVVNIKLRHDYHGALISSEVGNTFDKDNAEFRASIVFGAGDEQTNISGTLNYYHRNAIFNRDRGFSQRAVSLSSNSSPGNFQVARSSVLAIGVPPSVLPSEDVTTFFAIPPDLTNGLSLPNDYTYSKGRLPTFNFNRFSSSFPETERYGGFVNFDHKIFDDQAVVYGDLFYQNVQVFNQLAPSPTGPFTSPGQVPLAIPPHAPGDVVGGPTYAETGLTVGAYNPFNPFQQVISGGSRYRLAEFPNRIVNDETEAFFSTLGLRGDKLFDGTWGYDGAFRYSQVRDTASISVASRSRLNRIFNAADPIFDPTSPEFIGTTAPYNPFGDYRVPIPGNRAAINFATVFAKDYQTSKLATLDFTLYTTSLFKLPAGAVGFAVGGQFRRESISQLPDQFALDGDLAGSATENITDAGRKSFGISGETNIPIFGPANSLPGFYALELTASGRYEDYRNNNTNILVPKLGIRWQPFDESLTLRSTWGEGFREPSLFELYFSPVSGFFPTTDPLPTSLGGPPTPLPDDSRFDQETPILTKSNQNLQPEDSRNFTAGVVYTPKFVPALTVTVDLFDIERHDVVGAPDPNDVLKREARGRLLPGEEVLRDNTGAIAEIIFPFENNGGETARGVDFGSTYELRTAFGTFTWQTDVTWLESFRLSLARGAPALEVRSQGNGSSQDAFIEWKGRSRLGWTWHGFDLSTTVTYTDGFHEFLLPPSGREHWVKQTWFFDGQASYDFTFVPPGGIRPVACYSKDDNWPVQAVPPLCPWKRILNNTTVTIGCNNIFGTDPPKAYNGTNANYAEFIYDSVGRFAYLSLKKTF
jgi:iron complex outermembrane receptor protein